MSKSELKRKVTMSPEFAYNEIERLQRELAHSKSREEGLRKASEELTRLLDRSVDVNIDKLMALSDEQVTALTRLEGHDPDDTVRLCNQAFEIAKLKVEVEGLRKDAERLREALFWYRDESVAIALNIASKRDEAVMASIMVLKNDAGNRAITALAATTAHPTEGASREQT